MIEETKRKKTSSPSSASSVGLLASPRGLQALFEQRARRCRSAGAGLLHLWCGAKRAREREREKAREEKKEKNEKTWS
jgi:hypothetical protein